MGSHYHITDFNNIKVCNSNECQHERTFKFYSFKEAVKKLNEFTIRKKDRIKVERYSYKINYKSGETDHFKVFRVFREMELKRLLGEGEPIDRFVVEDGKNEKHIQEILDNGVIIVYSYETNKKITLFAPSPERIMNLYNSAGEFPPDSLLEKSDFNRRKGYNDIMNEGFF